MAKRKIRKSDFFYRCIVFTSQMLRLKCLDFKVKTYIKFVENLIKKSALYNAIKKLIIFTIEKN